MKAIQIKSYSKSISTVLCDIPIPKIEKDEVLLKVKSAAVNPLELLIMSGKLKLIYDYPMPLVLGNECSGIVEKVGENVSEFKVGDFVYTRLPKEKIGAFSEYVSVNQKYIARIPSGYDFNTSAAIPLAGLTAYQAIVEELEAKSGDTILITGGAGSFGQMAVPIAKSLGINVIVTGGERSRNRFINMGVDKYIDYKKQNYWEVLSKVDHVIDTIGPSEFNNELSVLKTGGRLLSLKGIPNKEFAIRNKFSTFKKSIFTLAGLKYDKQAKREGKEYRFMFVYANGDQLKKITKIVEDNNILPKIDPHVFNIYQANEALKLVSNGHTNGKVIIQL